MSALSNLPSLLRSNGASSSRAPFEHVQLHDPAATAARARIGFRDDRREDHVTVAHDRVSSPASRSRRWPERHWLNQIHVPTVSADALLLVRRAVIGGGSPSGPVRRPDPADRTRASLVDRLLRQQRARGDDVGPCQRRCWIDDAVEALREHRRGQQIAGSRYLPVPNNTTMPAPVGPRVTSGRTVIGCTLAGRIGCREQRQLRLPVPYATFQLVGFASRRSNFHMLPYKSPA